MIGQIENKIIDLIKAASDSNQLGYKLRSVKTYGGEMNDGLNAVVKTLPAIWVIFKSKEQVSKLGAKIKWETTFSILCAAKSLQNEHQSRHGSGEKVGSYQMIEDVTRLLVDENLGLEIDGLTPLRVFPVMNDKKDQDLASIYALEVKTRYSDTYTPPSGALDDFEQMGVDWDIPPLGNVTQPLPSANADASDLITLEQTP